jgi:predicted transcriptional regulator
VISLFTLLLGARYSHIRGPLWVLLGGHDSRVADVDLGIPDVLLLMNTVMILFNMIPAFPMDGGRVLRALLATRLPYARATRIAAGLGQGFAVLFAGVGLFTNHPMLMLVALFVFLAAAEERALVETRTSLSGLPVRAAMLTHFFSLDAREPLQHAVDYLMAGSQQDFPVLEGSTPIGVLTRADLAMALRQHAPETPVGEVVRRSTDAVDAADSLETAMQRMRREGRSSLPVTQQGVIIGMITLENVGDLLLVQDALGRRARA